MRNRCYNPYYGRFYSEDPIWSINLFPYADNNPLSKIDPNGENPILAFAGLAYLAYESGLIDGIYTAYTYINPKYTKEQRQTALVGFVAGVALPGGGYSLVGKNYKKVAEITVAVNKTEIDFLKLLQSISKGEWVKVFEAAIINGKKVELHYFRHVKTGKTFDMKEKYQYWHQRSFKKL